MLLAERRVGGELEIEEERAEEEEGAHLRMDEHRVLPEPSESRAPREVAFEDRPGIHIRAAADRLTEFALGPVEQLAEPVPHHPVVVVPARVPCDRTTGLPAAVVQRHDDRGAHPRFGPRRVAAQFGTAFEIRHLAMVARRDPPFERIGRHGRTECGDAGEVESQPERLGLEVRLARGAHPKRAAQRA